MGIPNWVYGVGLIGAILVFQWIYLLITLSSTKNSQHLSATETNRSISLASLHEEVHALKEEFLLNVKSLKEQNVSRVVHRTTENPNLARFRMPNGAKAS